MCFMHLLVEVIYSRMNTDKSNTLVATIVQDDSMILSIIFIIVHQ